MSCPPWRAALRTAGGCLPRLRWSGPVSSVLIIFIIIMFIIIISVVLSFIRSMNIMYYYAREIRYPRMSPTSALVCPWVDGRS